MSKCLTPDCHRHGRVARGLCNACWMAASRSIKAGQTTWAQLEQFGLAAPLRVKGTPKQGKFAQALAVALEKDTDREMP